MKPKVGRKKDNHIDEDELCIAEWTKQSKKKEKKRNRRREIRKSSMLRLIEGICSKRDRSN